jgi:hypothetical protein
LHGCTEQRQRLRNITRRRGGNPEQVHGIAVARLAGEHLTAEGSRLGQATLLLQRERLREAGRVAGHDCPELPDASGRGAG